MRLLEVKELVKKTLVERSETSVFLMGSVSSVGVMSFDKKYSDIDLLVMANCRLLDDYLEQIKAAIELSSGLNEYSHDPIDVFFLTSRTVDVYFMCLSVLAGEKPDMEKDVILRGKNKLACLKSMQRPSVHFKRRLYQYKARAMCLEYQNLLPVADTTQARTVAKSLMRLLKVLICATSADELDILEKKLCASRDFTDISALACKSMKTKLPDVSVFQDILRGNGLSDWSTWMVAQEDFARWLVGKEQRFVFGGLESRLYGGVCTVRDMLLIDLKNVFFEKDEVVRLEEIGKYVDSTASVVARLALSGVETLLDFTLPSTPEIIRSSYDIVADHLKSEKPTLECLVASIVLLEYGFEQALTHIIVEGT